MRGKQTAQGCVTAAVVVFLLMGTILFFTTSPENDRRGFLYMIALSLAYLVWTYGRGKR